MQRIFSRSFSTSRILNARNALGGNSLVEAVAVTADGKTVVAYHPNQEFPYELSKPLPTSFAEINSGSLLKETALNSAFRAFKDKKPEIARQELMNLTYTTKHRWFPRSRDKRAKNTPMDREYL
ncbi:hypothetical protein ACFFRR_000368 [Megaselia abdita]